jgi:hypothetical protein
MYQETREEHETKEKEIDGIARNYQRYPGARE